MARNILARFVGGVADTTTKVAEFKMREQAATKRDERLREIRVGDIQSEREFRVSESEKGREFRKGESEKERIARKKLQDEKLAATKTKINPQAYKVALEAAEKDMMDVDFEDPDYEAKKEARIQHHLGAMSGGKPDKIPKSTEKDIVKDLPDLEADKPRESQTKTRYKGGGRGAQRTGYTSDIDQALEAIDASARSAKSTGGRSGTKPLATSAMDIFIDSVIADEDMSESEVLKLLLESNKPRAKAVRSRVRERMGT